VCVRMSERKPILITRDDDTETVRTQLSTAGALSLINTQDAAAWGHGAAPSTMSVAEAEALFMTRLTCRR
jgi:hypothetical protein